MDRSSFVRSIVNDSGLLHNLIIVLLITIVTLIRVDFSAIPFEDAAILMRYAENFADGFGIAWNRGSLPVDGATDFLFVVLIGGLKKITGIGVEPLIYAVNVESQILSVYLAYYTLRTILNVPFYIAFISIVYLLLGPGSLLISTQFATPFFILLVSILWMLTLKVLTSNEINRITPLLFGIVSLLVGLTRPEGVFLTFFFLLSIIYVIGIKKSNRVILNYLAIMFVLGGGYFIWRWIYFGYPLPNPYYRKMGSGFNIHSLIQSLTFMLRFVIPFIPFLLMAFIEKARIKLLVAILFPVIAFTVLFIMIDSSMNFAGRFQYVGMFIVGMGWVLPLRGLSFRELVSEKLRSYPGFGLTSKLTLAFLLITIFVFQLKYSSSSIYRDGRYDVGIILSGYQDKDYKIACSEAGLIPFYSKLATLDTWGLNDQEIAHSGLISESILSRFNPDLIMFHAAFSPLTFPEENSDHVKMGKILKEFAENNGYSLIACYGISPFRTHYYYLKESISDFNSIKNRIKSIKYIWYENGGRCIDFSEFSKYDKK